VPTLTPGRRPKAPLARSGNTMRFVDRSLIKSFIARFEELASGAVAIGALAIADRSGLLSAMAGRGPVTIEELAVDEKGDDRFTPRYLKEILASLAGAGVVSYDPDTERFQLADEHAACLADPASPYSMAGWLDMIPAALGSVDRVTRATVEGGGIPLDDFDERIIAGIDRLNSPGTRILLTKRWLAAMPDVVAKLEEGARIADVGCGSGTAALVMAAAFPASTVVGYDIDPRAIARAHDRAAEFELANISFELIPAADMPGEFDLVTTFDVIHDLADPVEALSRIFTALSDQGTYLMVEPAAGASLVDNLNPRGVLITGFSLLYCLPQSLVDQGLGLGAGWGPLQAEVLCRQVGFTRFHQLPIENPNSNFFRVER
jgi:SAM-dependent methyltransferase